MRKFDVLHSNHTQSFSCAFLRCFVRKGSISPSEVVEKEKTHLMAWLSQKAVKRVLLSCALEHRTDWKGQNFLEKS